MQHSRSLPGLANTPRKYSHQTPWLTNTRGFTGGQPPGSGLRWRRPRRLSVWRTGDDYRRVLSLMPAAVRAAVKLPNRRTAAPYSAGSSFRIDESESRWPDFFAAFNPRITSAFVQLRRSR